MARIRVLAVNYTQVAIFMLWWTLYVLANALPYLIEVKDNPAENNNQKSNRLQLAFYAVKASLIRYASLNEHLLLEKRISVESERGFASSVLHLTFPNPRCVRALQREGCDRSHGVDHLKRPTQDAFDLQAQTGQHRRN